MNISDKLLQVKEVHKIFGEGQSETVALQGFPLMFCQESFLESWEPVDRARQHCLIPLPLC